MATDSVTFASCMFVLASVCFQLVGTAPLVSDWINNEAVKRCRGMPCVKWDAIQEKLAALKAKMKKENEPEWEVILGGNQQSNATIDGDIWPTMEIVDVLEEKLRTRHKRKLTVFSDTIKRWDVPIHYYIDSNFNSSQADAIRGAIYHWEAQTCIRFEEEDFYGATVRQILDKPFLYFVKDKRCGTFVGRVPDAIAQQIYLSDQCIHQWGAIVHEIGHIVGFWHEHQRSDRDGYITLFLDRMAPPVDYSQYAQKDTRNLVPYDYGSVMHYWAWSNSASLSRITIEPKDLRYLYTIGQKVELSFLDARLANIEYCSDKCTNAITCNNQGYQDPNNCNKCKCPDGYVGDRCERLEPPEKAECGGVILLGTEPGKESTYITSPGYNENKPYKDYTSCTWLIEAPENQKVNFLFMNKETDHFGMYCQYPVCFHWVEVKMTSSDMSVTGPRFCCENLNKIKALPGVLTSEGRHMMVLMRSNFTTSDKGVSDHNKGFRAFIWASAEESASPEPAATARYPKPTPTLAPKDPPPKLNLVFVMDSSGSVGADNWIKIKNFAKRVLYDLDLYNLDYQFGFVTFGSSGYIDIHLNRHTDYRRTSDLIDALPWKMESSNIADGIRKARQEIVSSPVRAPTLVVLVTDGPASAEQANTETEAQMLKTLSNTYLSVIGLTQKVNRSEIMGLASQPADKYARIFDSFDGLSDVVDQVTQVARQLGDSVSQTGGGVETSRAQSTTQPTTPFRKTTTSGSRGVTTTRPTTTTAAPTRGPTALLWRCSFELDARPFCGMTQEQADDQFDWTRHTGPTQSSDTGPNRAADGKYYIYIEASRPRRPNDRATIYIPEVMEEGYYCLRYQYNMYGYHIKELQVFHIPATGQKVKLSSITKTGDVGSIKWQTETLVVYLYKKSKIGFTGIRGAEYSGDIALDDISLRSGLCT